MEFYPKEPHDVNAAQSMVWKAVKVAFQQEEGAAYYRYPIADVRGFSHYEADILLALRHYGLFLIEVKGLYIHNIRAIQGPVWQTQHLRPSQEYPVSQARNQVFALKEWLKKAGGARNPYVHFVIALPFISREDWHSRGLADLPSTGHIVRTADLLTPDKLQQWVQETGLGCTL